MRTTRRTTRPPAVCPTVGILIAVTLIAAPGCQCCVSGSRLARSESEKQILAEQNQAQLAEIENLKVHTRNTEDRLMRTEEELTALRDEVGLDRDELAGIRRQRAQLHDRLTGMANRFGEIPPDVRERLAALSERYPNLHFDPVTGISKLQSDVLFSSGQAELRPGAEEMLGELVQVLKLPAAEDLKSMVVGHTDDKRIAKKPAREKFPNNFHLSTARAHAVADLMCRQGLTEDRIGVAGLGAHQPIAPNVAPEDRRKNRRVEIFVMNRDVPVVGWADSMPSLY